MTLTELESNSGMLSSEAFEASACFVQIELLHTSTTGYCDLYLAKRFGKRFILKTLKRQYADNPAYRELLKKEFEIGYPLSHPHIVQTLSFELIPELGHCIVLEYIDGLSLRSFLADGAADRRTIRKIVDELCDALQYIHTAQVIHRDLKPENILVTRNGSNVKVIDFGLSDSDSYAILKQPAGSKHYAAPEQTVAETVLDARADIYALGVILGELPFGNRRTRRVAARCCAMDREKRFENASEVRKALNRKSIGRVLLPFLLVSSALVAGLIAAYRMGATSVPPILRTYTDTVRIVQMKDSVVFRPQTVPAIASQNPIPGNIEVYNRMVGYVEEQVTLQIEQFYDQLDTLSTLGSWERYANESSLLMERLNQQVRDELSRHMKPSEPEYNLYLSSLKQIVQEKWLNIYNANAERQRDAILRINAALKSPEASDNR